MINANELRHNNYYILNGKVQQYNILSYGQWDLSCYEPIHLTNKILNGCGFVEDGIVNQDGDDVYFYYIRKPNGRFLNLDYFTFQPQDFGFPIVDYEIQYLHQLQNLYFALTGEELQYNPCK